MADHTPNFTREKDVESYYRHQLQIATNAVFQSPHNTDGLLEWLKKGAQNTTRLLLEAKLDGKFETAEGRARALAQCVYYMRAFVNDSKIPNAILIGDATRYFVIPAKTLSDYTQLEGVDWTRAPSSPCRTLVNALSDSDFVKGIYTQTLPIDVTEIKTRAENASEDHYIKTRVSVDTLPHVFEEWANRVYTKQTYSPATQVDIFLAMLCHTSSKDVYTHPVEPNTLVVNGSNYRVDAHAIDRFFGHYEQGYSPSETDAFMAMRDQLLEEEARRRQGAYYTHAMWANEAINLMDEKLGEGWRDDCIVWDCCAGTANLTRNHEFQNLILSTAEKSDIDAIKREEYNFGAEVFQYDFLNPNAPSPYFGEDEVNAIPARVQRMLEQGAKEGKRLVFIINPPYAEDGDVKLTTSRKKGVASNLVSQSMPKLGRANRQLYAQFMYQCDKLASDYGFTLKSIGVFCKPAFMTSGSFSKFRKHWYDRFAYLQGFMFRASHFADVSGLWGVTFTLWSNGVTPLTQDIPVSVKDVDANRIVCAGHKKLYNADGRKASDWVAPTNPKLNGAPSPKYSSGLTQASKDSDTRGLDAPARGVFVNKANCPQQNQIVLLQSCIFSDKGSRSIPLLEGDGWRRAIALFSARKLVAGTWINDKDEYLAPQTQNNGYEQWVDDCHIYALLHTSNNMTSMRGVEYKGKSWDINNHFFWLTRTQALKVFDTRDSARIFRDCKRSTHEPYFAQVLPSLNLSPLAQEILDDLNQLLIDTLPLRKSADQDLHLDAWDAGAYQLNKLLKGSEAWEALKTKHRALKASLEHGVYTYGFLKP